MYGTEAHAGFSGEWKSRGAGQVSFSWGIQRLLGGVPWELYASPGKGLAQAKGQEPKGVWLVGNGHTSSSLGCRARRTEVIAEA